MSQYVGSKWRKTAALMGSDSLRRVIPKTERFSDSRLAMMLARYGMVYVKPDVGTHGKGVIRVERSKGQYSFQLEKRRRTFFTFDETAKALRKQFKGKRYLIQRGIHLLTYRGRRFDIRVMAQLNPRKSWETTGMIGRVAAPRKIVTNYHGGGALTPVRRLLSGHVSRSDYIGKVRSLEKMGARAGHAMRRRFPGVCEIGLDIGFDRTLTPWIIEVNTRPDPYIFRKLSDPSIFRKIRRYAKAYGR